MWKFSIRRSLFEWVKPSAKESRKKADLSKCVPCVQLEFEKSSLLTHNKDEQNEKKEKEKKQTCHSFPKSCSRFFLDTFGWVGTAFFLGFHVRDKCWRKRHAVAYANDVPGPSHRNGVLCGHLCDRLLPLAFNMHSSGHGLGHNALDAQSAVQESTVKTADSEPAKKQIQDDDDISKVCEAIVGATKEYFGQIENFSGVSSTNKRKAFLHFRNGIKYGCSSAHFNLGICYEIGHGTNIDFLKAVEHYRMASDAGHSLAKYNLGVYYLEGKGGLPVDEERGLELISEAAEQGVLQAQTHMGIHYVEQQEWTRAHEFLNEASKGDPEAKYYLGLCYENGWGLNNDTQVAMKLYNEAAESGNSEALQALNSLSDKLKSVGKKLTTERKGIHAYSSFPELVLLNKESQDLPSDHRNDEISRYLNIIIPDMWMKSSSKATFWINESDEVPALRNEFSDRSQVMLSKLVS